MTRWKPRALGTPASAFRCSVCGRRVSFVPSRTPQWDYHTYDLLLVLVELNVRERLDEQLDEHDGILVAGPDALHEPRIAYAPLILDILQLRNVDAGRARRGRSQREALAHGGR